MELPLKSYFMTYARPSFLYRSLEETSLVVITGIPKREHKKRSPDAPKKVATGYVKFRQEELAKAKLAGSPLKDAVVRGMWKKVVEEKATSSPASEEPVSA